MTEAGFSHRRQEEQELFQALLRRLPSVSDTDELRDAAVTALRLLLRRGDDESLRQTLADDIVAALDGLPAVPERAVLRAAALRCVQILKTAKRDRLPRALQEAQPRWDRLGHGGAVAGPRGRPVRRKRCLGCWVAAVAVAGGAAAYFATDGFDFDIARPPLSGDLVRQIELALDGLAPPVNLYGGMIRVERGNGPVRVVTDKVPQEACVSAAWDLSHRGVVSVNGVTPLRATASRFAVLCRQSGDGALLGWTPKPGN